MNNQGNAQNQAKKGSANRLPHWMKKSDEPPYFALILAGVAALTLLISPFVSFALGSVSLIVALKMVRWDERGVRIGPRAVLFSAAVMIISAILMRSA